MQSGNMASLLFFPARWSRRIMSLSVPNKLAKVLWPSLITGCLNLMVIQCQFFFTMELSNNDSIPFIGTLITKNGNKLETQVYRKPTNTGLLLHFQSHTDLRYKKCLIKTMVHRAKELSSTHQAFVDECRHLKSMFHRLGSLFFGELYYRQM